MDQAKGVPFCDFYLQNQTVETVGALFFRFFKILFRVILFETCRTLRQLTCFKRSVLHVFQNQCFKQFLIFRSAFCARFLPQVLQEELA